MLSWLKRRAKVTINNRYINHLFRSNIHQSNMFVSEPSVSLLNDHTLKLTVFNTNGEDYSLDIPSVTTVENVKKMAVGHFFGLQAVGGSLEVEKQGIINSMGSGNRTYRLVVLREARPLLDVNPVHFEKLIDNDVLLLVESRDPPSPSQDSSEDVSSPTIFQINSKTSQLLKHNANRVADPANPSSDFQTEFRRILVTMIKASVRLISADPESKDVFNQILDKLERRQRPRVDRVALRQLTEMGFSEAKATKALQIKRGFNEAVEWLLDDSNYEDNDLKNSDDAGSILLESAVDAKNGFEDQQEDPAKKILRRFLQYRKKWFQPNPPLVQRFTEMGYPTEHVIDVLRATNNNEKSALEILVDKQEIGPDDKGLERDSPIISAILASPVIQLALPKPKTLLALMMLFESPNNANMWLSDPDTHPVVSQVFRIYHAEKHSLSRPVPAAEAPLRPVPATSVQEHPQPEATHIAHSSSPVGFANSNAVPSSVDARIIYVPSNVISGVNDPVRNDESLPVSFHNDLPQTYRHSDTGHR